METKELKTTKLVHELDKDTRNMLTKLLYVRMSREMASGYLFNHEELEYDIKCVFPEDINKDYEAKRIMHNVLRLFLLNGHITRLEFRSNFLDYTIYKHGCYDLRFKIFEKDSTFIVKVLNKGELIYGTFSSNFGTALYHVYKCILEWEKGKRPIDL